MVFDIPGGTGISAAIVDAIRQLANEVPIDVSALAQDDPVYNMGVDARGFIKAIAPTSANPPGGITGRDPATSTFLGVRPGTLVTYTLDFYNDFVEPRRSAVVFKAVINVIGNMTTILDTRNVYIVVPAGAIIFIE